MPASHPLSWRRSSAERGKGFDGATRCNTCGPMETQLAAYWLASGDLYLFRRLSEDLALASTVLVLRGAYLTQNLKYFDAISMKFLRMRLATECKVYRFEFLEIFPQGKPARRLERNGGTARDRVGPGGTLGNARNRPGPGSRGSDGFKGTFAQP